MKQAEVGGNDGRCRKKVEAEDGMCSAKRLQQRACVTPPPPVREQRLCQSNGRFCFRQILGL